jgi:RND superfamily putative drug exporter
MNSKRSFTGRIASFSFRHKWYVLAAWLVVFALSAAAASGLGGVLTTEQKDLSGSDSAKAFDLIEKRYGERPAVEILIVRHETQTVDSPAFQEFVRDLGAQIGATPGVAHVATYLDSGDPSMVSADRHAALTQVTMAGTLDEAEKKIAGVIDVVNTAPSVDGYELHLSGDAAASHEFGEIAQHDLEEGERIGLPVALIVMVLAFGTVVAAVMPLLLGLAAIIPAVGSVALIGRAFELSFFVTNVITMIGLAVGIDYSLFIIGRYREELGKGRSRLEAMEIAADSSGRAVFFSGMTVLLALAGMLLVRTSIFVSIGIGAMVVVVWAILASLTLLPALLGVIGRGINWLRIPFLGKAAFGTRFWGMVTNGVQKRPILWAAASAGLLIAAALPLTTIKLGDTGIEALPKETSTYQTFKALERDFSGGRIQPLQVVIDGNLGDPSVQAAIQRFETSIAQRSDVQWLEVTPDASGRTAIIEIVPNAIGATPDAVRIVDDLRAETIPQAFENSGATAYLGGITPSYVDAKAEMDAKLPIVFGFVLTLSFILLLLVFRSVAIPAKAIVMNLLSVGASYGIIVLVFQHGVGAELLGFSETPRIAFWIPLFLFSILFGLSMDYHVFLLSRVKEEYTRSGNNTYAVTAGVKSTAGMITSAAIIMVAVFWGFSQGRLVDMQQMGFGLALAVFLDATIIRSVLVPASMQLLGTYNWWMPSWLGWLPRLNVEGGAQHEPAPVPAFEAAAAAGD